MRASKKRREGPILRNTNEVNIKGKFVIDGKGDYQIKSSIDFLDHLFVVFSFHALFDLKLEAKGDLKHHLMEDLGISLGDAFKKALGDCKSIKRFGFSYVIMETALARVVIDISGRSHYQRDNLYDSRTMPYFDISETGGISLKDIDEFLEGFSKHAKLNIHVSSTYYAEQDGRGNGHHLLEAIFKALGIALDQATQIDPRRKGIPSTKGVID